MKYEITNEFSEAVLKLGNEYRAKYCIKFINIEVHHKATKNIRFINIHEFIHTHCRDYLLSYANGFKTQVYTKTSSVDNRILILNYDIFITVRNLMDDDSIEHTEIFNGLSELKVYVEAVEWLINYRKDNPKLSKFWIHKL